MKEGKAGSVTGERKLVYETTTGHILVGIFVLVAAAGFGWLLISQRLGPEKYDLIAEFDVLGSINEATKVKLRGFTIGQVKRIDFRHQPPEGEAYFLVVLGIEKRYSVPEGVVAEIRSSGLVGESYIDLNVSAAGVRPLSPGSHVEGRSDPGIKGLVGKIAEAARKLGDAGEGIKKADLGGKLRRLTLDVSRIADDLGRVSASAGSLLTASHEMMEGMTPAIERTLDGLDRNMQKLSQILSRADTLVAVTGEDVQRSLHSLRLMVERLESVLVRVDTLVQVKESQIDETLTNLHAASAAVRELTEHPWKLITGQGKGARTEQSTP